MNPTLLKALITSIPTAMLFVGAAALYARTRQLSALAQALGAACLLIVVFVHLCEVSGMFPSLGWGAEGSIGHYVDLAAALSGLALFPAGYLMHVLGKNRDAPAA